MKKITTIEEVISRLDEIVRECIDKGDPLGYFAALYRKVTIQVRDGIAQDFFDDGERMEKLDVVFALRYIVAYDAYRHGGEVTGSWQAAFRASRNSWPIVLQHLLLGMNAHINLDLGIAAVEVSGGEKIQEIEDDFNRINDILASLVEEVQGGLSFIWPPLRWILKKTGRLDNKLTDFSMQLARDGAWKFALELSSTGMDTLSEMIETRDHKVTGKAGLITHPGKWAAFMIRLIRLSEKGSVSKKIRHLS